MDAWGHFCQRKQFQLTRLGGIWSWTKYLWSQSKKSLECVRRKRWQHPGTRKQQMQQQKTSSEERSDKQSYPDYQSVAGLYLYMSEMRYETTFETQEVMRDASTPTVTSLKLTKRIAQMYANEVFNLRRGINDWKTPGERLGWDTTNNIIELSRGRGESNKERNVDWQLKCKTDRTQCRRTLETAWSSSNVGATHVETDRAESAQNTKKREWGRCVDETCTTSRPAQVEQFS